MSEQTEWKFPGCPEPPEWRLNVAALAQRFAWFARLGQCPQDATWHAEGDVLTHTGMVLKALVHDPAWRGLAARERQAVFAAAVFHDIGKPDCTREENGRIVSPGHSRVGAHMCRQIMMTAPEFAGTPFEIREEIVALVRWHGVPPRFLERENTLRTLLNVAVTARVDLLCILCEADMRGRISRDTSSDPLGQIGLFRDFAIEQGCLNGPYAFATDHTRVRYFHEGTVPATANLFHEARCMVTLMAGIPAAGKDTWCRANAGETAIVSLDALRIERGESPAEDQSAIVDEAKARAKELLRKKRDFIWNATNATRFLRDPLIGMLLDYDARVRIVYCEAPWAKMIERNARRDEPVPLEVMERLVSKLDIPDLSEAHEVVRVVQR